MHTKERPQTVIWTLGYPHNYCHSSRFISDLYDGFTRPLYFLKFMRINSLNLWVMTPLELIDPFTGVTLYYDS